jgi:serine/threonine-protein kinase RsbW
LPPEGYYAILLEGWECTGRSRHAREEGRSQQMAGAEYEVDLIINSNYKFIDIGHDLVRYLSNLIGFDEDTTHWIILAVREGISNAIKHGNKCDINKKVFVRMSYNNRELDVSIEDQGSGFDPESVQNPLLPENLLKPTGRGIFYIRSFMDDVRYEYKPNEGTVLKMKKVLPSNS